MSTVQSEAGECVSWTDSILQRRKERVPFNYNNFTKVDGIFTDGHPPQIIEGLRQTNIDIAGGNLQPARPVKVVIFNKLVVRSQDLSVDSQWHQIKLFPCNSKSLSFSISMKGRKNVEAFHFFRFNISLASIFSHGHKDYCNGHYNPKLIFIHQSWPAQVKGSIIES